MTAAVEILEVLAAAAWGAVVGFVAGRRLGAQRSAAALLVGVLAAVVLWGQAGLLAALLALAPPARALLDLLGAAGAFAAGLWLRRAAVPAGGSVATRSWGERPPARRTGAGPALLLLAALLVYLAVVMEHRAVLPDGGWDAVMIWTLRARWLYRTDFDLSRALSPHLAAMHEGAHLDYPLLLPTILARLYSIGGIESQLIAAAVSAAWGVACALGLLLAGRILRGGLSGTILASLYLATPIVSMTAAAGYADLLLSALLIQACLWTLLGATRDDRALLAIGGLFAGAAVCTKNEGALYLIGFAVGLWCLPLPKSERLRRAITFGACSLPGVSLAIWTKRLAPEGSDLLRPTGELLAVLGDGSRYLALGLNGLRRPVYFQAWGATLAAVAAALIALVFHARGRLDGRARFLLGVLATAAVGCSAALLTSPHGVAWHVRTALDRLLLQGYPLALLLLASLLETPARAAAAPPPEGAA